MAMTTGATGPTRTIHVVPVGNPPLGAMKQIDEPLLTHLGLKVVHSKIQLQTPTYAFNKDRDQYHSNAIMRRLVPLIEPGQHMVMGITDVDLFIPDSPFVFGESDRESKAAVVSVFRLRQGAEGDALRRRLQVEALQSAGHLVGLSYCEDARCAMFYAQAPAEVDRKNVGLCNLCRNEFGKLHR